MVPTACEDGVADAAQSSPSPRCGTGAPQRPDAKGTNEARRANEHPAMTRPHAFARVLAHGARFGFSWSPQRRAMKNTWKLP